MADERTPRDDAETKPAPELEIRNLPEPKLDEDAERRVKGGWPFNGGLTTNDEW